MTREFNTVLCPVCQQGRRSSTMTMPSHRITPWEDCTGSLKRGYLPEEGRHAVALRTGLMFDDHKTVRHFYRWVCTCGQKGPCAQAEGIAEARGQTHVIAMNKKEGKA